jgi:CRISPR system Cascade subunit CasE
MDEGYLAHCAMRELWQDRAPAPFVLRGRGPVLEAWGYSRCPAGALIEFARSLPIRAGTDIADLDAMASKPIPRFELGRRLGFHLRACPVVRLAAPTHGHKAGAEVDVFLARCFSAGADFGVSRESVYREWLSGRLGDGTNTGARVEEVRVAAMSRERLVRRTQGDVRSARRLERTDVRFEGSLVVADTDRFLECLARGVGRHRAFGFGALMLVPPGTSFPR